MVPIPDEDDMARDSDAVKTLKRYYYDRLAPVDMALLEQEVLGTSDRAAIILLASFLDSALEFALLGKMRILNDKEFERAFRSDGPLGAFSARIDMCYLFNVIDDPLRLRLHDLREMRNACAHSRRAISFKNPELANVGKRFLKDATFPLLGSKDTEMKASIVAECFYLFGVISSGKEATMKSIREAYERSGKTPPWK